MLGARRKRPPPRPAGPAPTLTRYFMVLPGQRPRCPRTARRPCLTSQPPPRPPAPVHFAPPARLPACPAAPPLAAVVPHANKPRWAGRGGRAEVATARCGHSRLPRLLALLAKILRRHRPAPSLSAGAAPPSFQMLAFCLPYPPTLPTNTGVFTICRVRGIRSEFLGKMGGVCPQKQLLKTTIL